MRTGTRALGLAAAAFSGMVFAGTASAAVINLTPTVSFSDDPTDPLVWIIDCAVAPCTGDNIGTYTGEARFTFATGSAADRVKMTIEVENTTPAGPSGGISTVGMEMPEAIIDAVLGVGGGSDTALATDWSMEYDPDQLGIQPFGIFDLCLSSDDNDNFNNCQSGDPNNLLLAGQIATFVIDIDLSSALASLSFADIDPENFTGLAAFKALFASSIVLHDNGEGGSGLCTRWQRTNDDSAQGNGGSEKICGKLVGDTTPVSEPITLALLGLGLLGIGVGMNRRGRSGSTAE